MNKKELLKELCASFEKNLARANKGVVKKVELFSGLRYADYGMPAIHVGTTQALLDLMHHQKDSIHQNVIWVVEITVDGQVVFMDSEIPSMNSGINFVEINVINRIIDSIFGYGINAAYNIIYPIKK